MKKIVFLHLKGNTIGGVYNVDHTLALELLKLGYEVHFITLREYDEKLVPYCDPRIINHVINGKILWRITRKREVVEPLRKLKIKMFLNLYKKRQKQIVELRKDYKKTKLLIKEIDPNYIVTTQYQQLDAIPKEYLRKTVTEHHNSFKYAMDVNDNIKVFNKYKNKIFKFIWLTKNTCASAIKYGYGNSKYIYNAVRFETEDIAPVIKNKKLITITRVAIEQKRIDLMIKIADKVLRRNKDWTLEIYGEGTLDKDSYDIINKNPKIKLMGKTDKPKDMYLEASINLNTSEYEGFSLSILEANECGVPTISFDFGESVYEQIIDGETGIIVNDDDIELYINKLTDLMNNEKLLLKLSLGCKEYNKNFRMNKIVKEWLELFKEIDTKNNGG